MILLTQLPHVSASNFEEDDPENDLYQITMLDFLYVIGDTTPEDLDTENKFKDFIQKVISRSETCTTPEEIDTINSYYSQDADDTYGLFMVEFDGDFEDLEYAQIIGLCVHDDDTWCYWEITLDDGHEDYSWETETEDDDDALGGIGDNYAGIWVNFSAYTYSTDDSFYVIAMTLEGDFSDPLHSNIIYDVYPNSLAPEEQDLYEGDELITTLLNDFAQFLFGWLFKGHLPFLFLIALLIVTAQVLLDRKNKIMHWIGFGCLLFMLWPIFFYSIALNLVGILGLPNIFSLSALIILLWFSIFIVLSLCNNFGVLKHYRFAFISVSVSMVVSQIINLILIMTQEQIISLFILAGSMLGLLVILKLSKRYGRNKFKEA